MQLTTAQKLLQAFFGHDPQLRGPFYYKAPHAPQGTPPRKHFKRRARMVFSKAHDALIPVRSL